MARIGTTGRGIGPAYEDKVGRRVVRVADLAVFVIDAAEGVEVQTEHAWEIADKLGVPRMIFINKLDKERASFDRTLASMR